MMYIQLVTVLTLQFFVQNAFSQHSNYGSYPGFANMRTYGSYNPLASLGLASATNSISYNPSLAQSTAYPTMYTDVAVPVEANLALIESLPVPSGSLTLLTNENMAAPSVNLVPPIAGVETFGGTGMGDIVVTGEMPVGGTTLVTGQVPIVGSVRFAGDVAASGIISLSGKCGCGCGLGE